MLAASKMNGCENGKICGEIHSRRGGARCSMLDAECGDMLCVCACLGWMSRVESRKGG